MKGIKEIRLIFEFFIKYMRRQKKIKFFVLLSAIPIILFILIFSIKSGSISVSKYFKFMSVWYYFQFFIPIMALFLGNSIISEEVENKTLHYLTSSSVKKSSIILGKYFSYSLISLIIINLSLLLMFVVSLFFNSFKTNQLGLTINFILVSIPSFFAYFSLFLFASTFLKKPAIVGIIYLFGWEVLIQFLPGSTQRFSVNHYMNSLLPSDARVSTMKFLQFFVPEKPLIAVIALILISLIFLIISILIFKNKEYLLND